MVTTISLGERVEALADAVALAGKHLPPEIVADATTVVEKAQGRLRHGTDHTVVALVGPTGAGKSTLFNALAGHDISSTGVRRPTTGHTHAAIWGDGAGQLLDWLGVSRRHHLDPVKSDPSLTGLVLLDLPDFDSTAVEHRLEVDRIVELVDLLIWVSDPQKYADEVFHRNYLAAFSDHGSVMGFVLNKADTVSDADLDVVVDDFTRRITDDGIDDPRVIAVTATADLGLAELRAIIAEEVASKRAASARLDADVRAAARSMNADGSPRRVSSGQHRSLVESLGRAAGIELAADLTATQHRRSGRHAMTWPPMRWLRNRRSALADLPRPGATAASSAEIAAALRTIGEVAGDDLDRGWATALRRTAQSVHVDVEVALTAITDALGRGQQRPPRWWTAVAAAQRVLGLAALAGLVWLFALAVLGGLLMLDTDPLAIDTPGATWIPLPTLLLLGGAGAGLVLGWLVRLPLRLGARRRAAKVRTGLLADVRTIADEIVLSRLTAVLDERTEVQRLLAVASRQPAKKP